MKNINKIIDDLFENHNKAISLATTTTLLALLGAGITISGNSKEKGIIREYSIEQEYDYNLYTDGIKDLILTKIHNKTTEHDSYFVTKKIQHDDKYELYDVISDTIIYDSTKNNTIIDHTELGAISEYLISYNIIKQVYNKDDLEEVLNLVTTDMQNNKKLVK